MTWEQLTMLHWRYPAPAVQALLPSGVTVETYDGSAWVGLIPFQMRVRLPVGPEMARILHFPETNVRTYVTAPDGRPGVWFFSLEASSLPAVVTARSTYGLPYFWSDMTLEQTDDRVRYVTFRRRWPKPAGASSVVDIEIGAEIATDELSDLDHFLTGRWALFGKFGPRLSYGKMNHEPWPLHRVDVLEWRDELVAAGGLAAPTGAPVAHYSPGVTVRCGWPQIAGPANLK